MNIAVHMSISVLVSLGFMPCSGIAGSYGSSDSLYVFLKKDVQSHPFSTFNWIVFLLLTCRSFGFFKIYFWLCWVLVVAQAFLWWWQVGGRSLAVLWGLVTVASLVAEIGLQGVWASVIVAHELSSCNSRATECWLISCGTRTQLLWGMWDLPGYRTHISCADR